MLRKYRADALHGDMSQAQRDKVMKRFKAKSLQVLIATDVAARGIDVNDLTHVFHYTLPDQNAYYTHRSGRTARAGKKGVSIAFIGSNDQYKIKMLQKKLGIKFTGVDIPSAADIVSKAVEKWGQEVLDTKTKGRLDDELIEKANMLFDNLSKEELTAKILMYELQKLNVGSDRDLNDKLKQRGEGGGRSERGRGGRRSGGRGNYKGKKKSYGRSGGSKGGKKKGKSGGGFSKDMKSRYKKKKKKVS